MTAAFRRGSRSKFAVLAAILVFLTQPVSGPPQAAAATQPGVEEVFLEGPEVVYYGIAPYELAESTQLIRQGERSADGGCLFISETTLRPNESRTEIEVAFDPATCRSLVEVGTLVSGDDFLTHNWAGQEKTLASDGTLSSSPPELLTAAALRPRQFASEWSWYDEPARWAASCDVEETAGDGCLLPPVNSVYNGIEWQPDGVCAVAPGTIGRVDYEIRWLSGTGWNVIRDDWTHSPDPIPCEQDIFSRNINQFQNTEFCFTTTNTWYEPNEVRGDKNGNATFQRVARKGGFCSSLLRFGHKERNF
jgi:hypothetical protein